jgi:hypothetical protein
MVKQCNCCGEVKPLEAFGVDHSCLSGRRGDCKVCRNRKERKPRTEPAPKCDPLVLASAWRDWRGAEPGQLLGRVA